MLQQQPSQILQQGQREIQQIFDEFKDGKNYLKKSEFLQSLKESGNDKNCQLLIILINQKNLIDFNTFQSLFQMNYHNKFYTDALFEILDDDKIEVLTADGLQLINNKYNLKYTANELQTIIDFATGETSEGMILKDQYDQFIKQI